MSEKTVTLAGQLGWKSPGVWVTTPSGGRIWIKAPEGVSSWVVTEEEILAAVMEQRAERAPVAK